MGMTFDCEIQARLRDMNLGGHVDSVEAVRIIDEGRLRFLRFATLPGDDRPGLLRDLPEGVTELVASQRVDYHAEMRFVAHQPFLLRLWVDRVGTSSFTLSTQLRVAPGRPPALVARTTVVLFDHAAERSWPFSDEARAAFEAYAGEPIALRA